jgi:hypothetical protein
MKAIEEETDLSQIDQFYVGFQHFWFQTEFLSHQNMMTDTSEKVMEAKTLQLGRMNQVIILSLKQRLLTI